MNVLTDRLPDTITVSGAEYPICTDFRTWIRFELMAMDGELRTERKITEILKLIFLPGKLPPSFIETMDAIRRFYAGGSGDRPTQGGAKPAEAIYSFEYDADYIYSAFLAQYGIDLQTASLHWWQFKALFKSLGEENMIVKIMEYRSVNLSDIKDKGQKDFYRKMKRRYALPKQRGEEEKLREIEQALMGDGNLTGVL